MNSGNYKYAGATLMPSMAEELILELFNGRVVERKEIVDTVVQTHVYQGGKNPNSEKDRHWLNRALLSLKKKV